MPDNVAMNFRKTRGRPAEEAAPASGPSLLLLAGVSLAVGVAAVSVMGGSPALPALPAIATPWRSAPPPVATTPAEPGPRIMAVVPGVREVSTAATGMTLVSPAAMAQVYAPVGPVVLRRPEGYVEIDGPRLLPPPIGPRRGGNAVYDHAAVVANELRTLAYTPCDRHLRHLAAANINLFVGGFMAPRTPVNTAAPADAAFWRRAEASIIRRAVVPLAEKGALSVEDFGLDASPQARGLFEGLPTKVITCR